MNWRMWFQLRCNCWEHGVRIRIRTGLDWFRRTVQFATFVDTPCSDDMKSPFSSTNHTLLHCDLYLIRLLLDHLFSKIPKVGKLRYICWQHSCPSNSRSNSSSSSLNSPNLFPIFLLSPSCPPPPLNPPASKSSPTFTVTSLTATKQNNQTD